MIGIVENLQIQPMVYRKNGTRKTNAVEETEDWLKGKSFKKNTFDFMMESEVNVT